MSIRRRFLLRAFSLLYGPLVVLHEPAGVCLFGQAWHGRRRDIVGRIEDAHFVVDLGSGSGRLVEEARAVGIRCFGIEPSHSMLRLARRTSGLFVRARSEAIPLMPGSVDAIVATYPGPWIQEQQTWHEVERVLAPGGKIIILLGGTVTSGRVSTIRSALLAIAYGRGRPGDVRFEPPIREQGNVTGRLLLVHDRWGMVYLWEGYRI